MKNLVFLFTLLTGMNAFAEVSVNEINRLKLSLSKVMHHSQSPSEETALEDLFYLFEYHENLIRQPNFLKNCDKYQGEVALTCEQYSNSSINPRVIVLWEQLEAHKNSANKIQITSSNNSISEINRELIELYLSNNIFVQD